MKAGQFTIGAKRVTEALQTGRGEDQSADVTLSRQFLEPRRDIAANGHGLHTRVSKLQLALPARTARGHDKTLRQVSETLELQSISRAINENIAHILTLCDCPKRQPFG